ncbi:MAG: carbamoyltransferase HypF [Acidimicrobiaceae bacterium]|nr:carbamoyltransferase HypF [Acidimicrobiaceae bacterium]
MTRAVSGLMRWRIRVSGVVQGVGFRPFVASLATARGLRGFVGNDGAGVFIEIEGAPSCLEEFLDALSQQAPPLARIEQLVVDRSLDLDGSAEFRIVASRQGTGHDTLVSADARTCSDCLREMSDPGDRRYRYAFTNCTNCGPRYSIVRDIPYDRANTTMATFVMCPRCRGEYDDPLDRRFHAQPLCCPDCGPHLQLLDGDGDPVPGDPVEATAALLGAGRIVAVKGIGGYHLAADANDERAVTLLRSRKHREQRPFAVMARDLDQARELCEVGDVEARLLGAPAAPILLLRRHSGAKVARSVAPGRDELGIMLPYSPMHHLLLGAHGRPLVMTSGNLSDEPIAFDDLDASKRLGTIADARLTHDRPIQTRVDDSVVRVSGGYPAPVRRSRGYAPDPLGLPWEFPREVLACGPELKNTFCLGRARHAFLSHHIGDLENFETFSSFTSGIAHLCRLFDIHPEVLAHDLHPEYLSTKYALDQHGVDLVGVQHHHAHVASCMADNGVEGPVIGVAFDGLGMGTDGSLWGGEFLVADLCGFERVASLEPVAMPGGALAVRQPWRMAAAYLERAGCDFASLGVRSRNKSWEDVLAGARAGLNAPMTSSMGRLFDAVSAVLDLQDTVTYEGQAAIELEQVAAPCETGRYEVAVAAGMPWRIDAPGLVRAVVDDRARGTEVGVVAARFHNSVGRLVLDLCCRIRDERGIGAVALSGGVFQNRRLLEQCIEGLSARGLRVMTHRRVPTNDGGISLGQAAVAGALDRAGGARAPGGS